MPTGLEFGTRFRTVKSAVTPIAFSSGNVVSQELPRSFLYKSIILRLSGSINATVANTGNAPESPLGLISKIELIADGRKVLFSSAGRDLYRLSHVMRGFEPERFGPNTLAIQTTTLAATIVIDNQAIRMQSPVDSYFDPRPYEKIELRVTWGTVANVVTGGTATVVAGTQIDIIVEQTTEGADLVMFNRLVTFDESLPTAATTNFIVTVPRSGLLAGILVRSDTSAGVPSDAIINNVSLKSDNNFLHKDRLAWATLQTFNAVDFQAGNAAFAFPALTGGVGGRMPTGYAYVDLTEDGLITSCLNTLDLNVLQLIYDVAGAGTIRSNFVFFEPIVTA
jgi:hypothetical protein